ncbi:MAG: DUF2157 domain-containing protein [Cyanothece sp. SIO1E1]|nr:DUF2157 domain-containing protein [Cyanothece sp. SIO1E1]
MASDKFRRQLRQEAESWKADGLIDVTQYQQLSERYQFQSLETAARNRLIIVLIGLGSILLGLGVITFVAANWQVWPRSLKVVLLLGLFIGVNLTGFCLWRQPGVVSWRQPGVASWKQRLGEGLLILAALILGANMALMGQMFHRSGSAYELCLFWGVGVLAMAYALRLASLSVLSVLLVGLGYWLGIQDLANTGVPVQWGWVMQTMPLLVMILFVPLAYWCRSRVVFGLAAIALVSSLTVIFADLVMQFDPVPGLIVAIAITLPFMLLWGYNDTFWWLLMGYQPAAMEAAKPFRPIACSLTLIGLSILYYILSFHGLWFDPDDVLPLTTQWSTLMTANWPILPKLTLAVVATLAVGEWIYLGYSARLSDRRWRLDQTTTVLLVLMLLAALVTFWHWTVQPIQVLATFIFNVLLFLLALGLMREGLGQGQRRAFWSGLVLLTLQIMGRLFEYNTGLLFKSFAFVLCGIGVIAVGLWFERYVRTLQPMQPRI